MHPPGWQQEALSWSKLDNIEVWLDSPSAQAQPYWRVEGQLLLAEGRAVFLDRDRADGKLGHHLSQRAADAKRGFEVVLRDPEARPSQAERARRGLSELDGVALREASTQREDSSTTLSGVGSEGLVRRAQWGAARPNPANMDPHSATWRWITVHHSAMPNPSPLDGSLWRSAAAVRRIQEAHMQGRDYGDLGYHFMIDPWGRVFEGRELKWQGAHTRDRNPGNVGVCLIGNFDNERPTEAALRALRDVVDGFREKYSIPRRNVKGHGEWVGTRCPGTHLLAWVKDYR